MASYQIPPSATNYSEILIKVNKFTPNLKPTKGIFQVYP